MLFHHVHGVVLFTYYNYSATWHLIIAVKYKIYPMTIFSSVLVSYDVVCNIIVMLSVYLYPRSAYCYDWASPQTGVSCICIQVGENVFIVIQHQQVGNNSTHLIRCIRCRIFCLSLVNCLTDAVFLKWKTSLYDPAHKKRNQKHKQETTDKYPPPPLKKNKTKQKTKKQTETKTLKPSQKLRNKVDNEGQHQPYCFCIFDSGFIKYKLIPLIPFVCRNERFVWLWCIWPW